MWNFGTTLFFLTKNRSSLGAATISPFAFYPIATKARPPMTHQHTPYPHFSDDSIFEPDAARLYLIFIGDVVLSTFVFWQMVHAPLHPWSGNSVSLYECAVAIFIAILSLIRLLTSLLLFSIVGPRYSIILCHLLLMSALRSYYVRYASFTPITRC